MSIADAGAGIGAIDVAALASAMETGKLPVGARCRRIALFLPICKTLVETMSGSFNVSHTSTQLTFEFTLPYTAPRYGWIALRGVWCCCCAPLTSSPSSRPQY